ncbi:arsenate reductase/protein-tyrosine-phosphatase family protein [Pontibaca salina]|uniref:Helix-turn-helix domain-containing protein n=1 Tax=Pontibaca salina TaxID=2795731 RepID=A0A934HP63_9RHOB|nr:helix-turn-helix domain-containing protein [Pontibaca salina]MBI6629192.1 helix-turn-helix domain-containing protein [Pontibaca salina]
METLIPNRLSTLGHPQRLALFRLLMRRYPDRVPATELARALGLKPNTLSTYVNALRQDGLVSQERVGTSLRYAIDMDAARETIDYLLHDCCRGRPEICAPKATPAPAEDIPMSDRKYNVLFICTGNSARSIMAESILRDIAGDRFLVYSAGTAPRSALNSLALEVLELKGHDVSVLRSKNIAEFQGANVPDFDFVFTVCNQAANEECPSWPGQPLSAHWGLPDPVKVEGSDAEKRRAFHQTYAVLRYRMIGFTTLPIGSLDRITLQKAIDEIGQSNEERPSQ